MRKWLFRNSSVFNKLTRSYVIVIVGMALLISLPLFQVFSSHYFRRVIDLHDLLLEQNAKIVTTSIIDPVFRTYVNMQLDSAILSDVNLLFEPDYSTAVVLRLINHLRTIVNASEGLIEAIHIHMVDNQFLLSTSIGLKYFTDMNLRLFPELVFATSAQDFSGRHHWTSSRTIMQTTTIFVDVATFFGTFPPSQTFENAQGIVAININKSRILSVLTSTDTDAVERLLILNPDGRLVADTAHPRLREDRYNFAPVSVDTILEASSTREVVYFDGKRSLINSHILDNGWILASVIPVDTLYATNRVMIIWIALIATGALVLCWWRIRRFLRTFTQPLKSILARLKHYQPVGEGNEFDIIDDALMEMNTQINNLNKSWEDNLPALKQGLLRNLINRTYPSERSVIRLLKDLGATGGRYGFILIDLLEPESIDPTSRNMALVRYLEDLSTPEHWLVAGEHSVHSIRAMVVSQANMPESLLVRIVYYIWHKLGVECVISVGAWYDTPLDVYRAYHDALEAGKDIFFRPELNIFIANEKEKEESSETFASVFQEHVLNFKDALTKDKQGDVAAAIHSFIRSLCGARLSYNAKQDYLAKMVVVLDEYRQSTVSHMENPAISYPIESVTDIHEYETWLENAAEQILKRKVGDEKDVIGTIKEYISENLGKELSLTSLSEYTALSNSYISHIFREKTGMKLMDYITRERMISAKDLLSDKTKTIESIARMLGYQTPHYFTKRFRQHYGMTPQQYRAGE